MNPSDLIPESLKRKIPRSVRLSKDTIVLCRLFHPASGPQTDYYLMSGHDVGEDYVMFAYTHGIENDGCTGYQPLSSLENCRYFGLSYERDIRFKARPLSEVAAPEFLRRLEA